MTDPIQFPTATPRFGLPLLFAGQAQKEFFVNEAHALTDALLCCVIEGVATAPPATPADGTAWLIGSSASGAWLGNDGAIACRQMGNWIFVPPRDGLRVVQRSTGQSRIFLGSWKVPAAPLEPIGGSIVDAEARVAIAQLITALRVATVLPSP